MLEKAKLDNTLIA